MLGGVAGAWSKRKCLVLGRIAGLNAGAWSLVLGGIAVKSQVKNAGALCFVEKAGSKHRDPESIGLESRHRDGLR